ncbi:Peroxidase 15 [Dichanthelium oligosanthes]|uniref:Peroxidase n=1 Tax=Dichanthelium oligosanthes TaxID=888268 RepID=A0A1E5W139_9POAL|nr:Peroxidase 15 [Dichanthelium oligosanthes]
MASSTPHCAAAAVAGVLVVLAALSLHGATAQLCETYYDNTCPDAYTISEAGAHRRPQGCDGSILLDGVPAKINSEKGAIPNNGSARGYPVVDKVKAALEAACPGVVSCADILALAAEISVELSGGPKWGVLLGRLDGVSADINGANNLPAPFENLITVLQGKFKAVGLNNVDLVALSGAHTFGRAQCLNVAQGMTDRLYNFSGTNRPDPTLDPAYRAFLSQRCPKNRNENALNDLDPTTPDTFDKNYYNNLEVHRGFLISDQELKSSPQAQGTAAPIVDQFARSQDAFFKSFAQSIMINMGEHSHERPYQRRSPLQLQKG